PAHAEVLRQLGAHLLDARLELLLLRRLRRRHVLVAGRVLHGDRRGEKRFGAFELRQFLGGQHGISSPVKGHRMPGHRIGKLRVATIRGGNVKRWLAGALMALLPLAALAQFPERPVRIVVPLPPGGSPDTIARTLAQNLQGTWNQPVVVDNRTGGSQNIGADVVAKSPPDGYNWLLAP